MRNTEKKRTGGNWGICEGLLRRFHLVGRKCNVLFYRRRRIFFSFHKFTSDILSFCHEVLEYKISHWSGVVNTDNRHCMHNPRGCYILEKCLKIKEEKRYRITKEAAKYTCAYEIKREYVNLRFFKYHDFKI